MKHLIWSLLLVFALSFSAMAEKFVVHETGPVTGYFVGQSAAYTNVLTPNFSDSQSPSPYISINNHTAIFGQQFDYGSHTAGANVLFSDFIRETGDFWHSSSNLNADGLDHFFYSAFSLPDGTPALFVGFEDIRGLGDNDRNDVMAIFTNVSPVPEPETYAMLLIGLFLVGVAGRKRNSI